MNNLLCYNLAENLKPSAKINKISSQLFLYKEKNSFRIWFEFF